MEQFAKTKGRHDEADEAFDGRLKTKEEWRSFTFTDWDGIGSEHWI